MQLVGWGISLKLMVPADIKENNLVASWEEYFEINKSPTYLKVLLFSYRDKVWQKIGTNMNYEEKEQTRVLHWPGISNNKEKMCTNTFEKSLVLINHHISVIGSRLYK